jgi:hypothetical protein
MIGDIIRLISTLGKLSKEVHDSSQREKYACKSPSVGGMIAMGLAPLVDDHVLPINYAANQRGLFATAYMGTDAFRVSDGRSFDVFEGSVELRHGNGFLGQGGWKSVPEDTTYTENSDNKRPHLLSFFQKDESVGFNYAIIEWEAGAESADTLITSPTGKFKLAHSKGTGFYGISGDDSWRGGIYAEWCPMVVQDSYLLPLAIEFARRAALAKS